MFYLKAKGAGKDSVRDRSLESTMIGLLPLLVVCWCLMFSFLSWNVEGINDRD